ncbi:hypothetical protein CLOM_g2739 [Closterium sp. NIES-68]|nr:hypothetical protein CLOM_g2739 [Closterium sp. NIES-68]
MDVPSTNVPSTNVRRACGAMATEFHLATNAGSPRDGFLSLSAVISAGAASGAVSGAAACAASGAAGAAGTASVGGAVNAAAAAAGAGCIAGAPGAAGADCSLECLGVWHERRAGRGVCHERRAGSSVSHESQQKRPAGPLWHGAAKKPCGVRSRLHAGTQSPPPHLMLYCCPAAAVTATAAAPTAATGAALTGAPTAANGPALTGAPTAAPTPTVTSTMTRSAAAAGTDGDAAWCRNTCRPGMVGAAQVKIRAPAQAPSQTRDSRTSCTAHPNGPQSSSSPRCRCCDFGTRQGVCHVAV